MLYFNRMPQQVLLRQRGCSQGVLWRLEAEALLEVEEVRLPLGRREARFSMLEGDFQVRTFLHPPCRGQVCRSACALPCTLHRQSTLLACSRSIFGLPAA